MFRMTRFEFLSRMLKPTPRAPRKKRSGERAQKTAWECFVGGGTRKIATVYAFTRGEARHELKKILGITKGRLPLDYFVARAA